MNTESVLSEDRLPLGLSARDLADLGVLEAGGNQPVPLDDPDCAWLVERGALDVFLVERAGDETVAGPAHVLRVDEGGIAFGLPDSGTPLVAFARSVANSKLRRVPVEALSQADLAEVAKQVDFWVQRFSDAVAREIEPHPQPDFAVGWDAADESLEVFAGAVIAARPDVLLWARAEPGKPVLYLGSEPSMETGTRFVPVASVGWITAQAQTQLTCLSTLDMLREQLLLSALAEFHSIFLEAEHFNRRLQIADEINEQAASLAYRRRTEKAARQHLYRVLGSSRPMADESDSELFSALQLIGNYTGIEFVSPPRRRGRVDSDFILGDILDTSGVRARRVSLLTEDRWWRGDAGALLGYREEGAKPVALFPGRWGRYRMVDPKTGRSRRLSAADSAGLRTEAWCFYRPLPEDRPASTADVIELARRGLLSMLLRFSIAGLLASAVTLVPSMVVGALASSILPNQAKELLPQVVVALLVFTLIGVLLNVIQGMAMMRMEGRIAARVSAALWDRVLRLPTAFFKRFTVGDLTTRLFTFQNLRDQISGVVSNSLFSVVFLVPTLGLLFFYDVELALVSATIAVLFILATAAFGVMQFRHRRRVRWAYRTIAGDLLQFVNGMGKLRSAGAEASAFASWARVYREQVIAGIYASNLNGHLIAFSLAVPALASAALFSVAVWRGTEHFSVADFLVVHAVSMTFFVAVTGVGRAFQAVAALVPSYEQVKELLTAVPETRNPRLAMVQLRGDLRIDRMSFRYSPEGPLILDDVSIRARPGEFVALVGESGAGKSTLLRLALGLEDPLTGGVYYDGRDLTHLDKRTVRRQVGVVTQSGALAAGDILDNIVGVGGAGSELTIDDAWRAARLAAVDADIEAMPMGMFTMVSDSAATFSGGQIQRIRIAAALVRNPRIVFLDEATNWLDNNSQAKVMEGIKKLSATRIVIAHRLSTIREAQRIYVLEQGRVVQEGGFDELYDVEGPFRRLVQRQQS